MNSFWTHKQGFVRLMRAPARAAAALLFLAFTTLGFQAVPPAQGSGQGSAADASQEKKATVEGVVVDALTGSPVKDATLLLASTSAGNTPSSTRTDEEGHFAFQNVNAGTYMIVGEHPRYARQMYGSRNGLLGGTPITLTAGREMKDIRFSLQPNAVASGRVLDEEGEPLAGVLVMAMKGMYQRGKRQYLPLGTATTNDTGEYRIANLAAGQYLLSAAIIRPGAAVIKAHGDQPEQAYITTYYPNATDASGAAPVRVAAGGEVGGMDIKMAKARSVTVKGRVVGAPPDQPVVVRLVPKGAGLLGTVLGRMAPLNKEDGTFEIAGATRGSYTLLAGDARGLKPLGIGMALEVGDRPIEGVVLQTTGSTELAGAITIERDEKAPAAPVSLKGTRVFLEGTEGITATPPNVTVNEDGTFTFKDFAPDKYLVRLINPPQNAFVQSVHLGPQAMTDDGFELGASATAKLDIKIRLAGAQVDGVVRDADGKAVAGVTVALIPDSGSYLLYNSTLTDQQGLFTFKALKPGNYKLLSWEEIELNAFMDPEFVKPFAGSAEAVTMKENDQKAVTLKVIQRQ